MPGAGWNNRNGPRFLWNHLSKLPADSGGRHGMSFRSPMRVIGEIRHYASFHCGDEIRRQVQILGAR